ncbi:hypothetical protein D1AOALGA4SA_10943 [Olavius algarvensis Delta 1 endosymbiont]|nr:hypothetical protein D1AOALGA4SA_10943 [Olavius algarvensis Delta 1 endosymbiont]
MPGRSGAKTGKSCLKKIKSNPFLRKLSVHRSWERFSTAITRVGNRGRRPIPQTFNLYLNGFENVFHKSNGFFIQYRVSSIQDRASSIQYRASSIQHRASSIEYPASRIQHRASSIQHHFVSPAADAYYRSGDLKISFANLKSGRINVKILIISA